VIAEQVLIMKRFASGCLLVAVLAVMLAPFMWAAPASSSAGKPAGDRSPGAPVATAISTVTGIAISPLLGTAGYGAYKWSVAKDDAARARLPWFAQPKFWVPALLVVAICAAKDAFGATVPPGWKKPLDVLETIENKFSGLIAAGAVVPLAMDAFSKLLLDESGAIMQPHATSGLAMLPLAAFNLSWLLDLLTVPFGIAVFAVVWLASHTINVLILLSPWGAIDAALKAGRTALLGLVTLSATINPWVGAILSLVVIAISLLIAGWAFRLTVFGTVFCWDFLTRRRTRFAPGTDDNLMFAGPNFPGVPVRTYGRLVRRDDGRLDFVYRPWLRLPERTAGVPVERSSLAVGQGLFFSDIVAADGRTLFLLPPRYRGHEEAVVRAYALGGGVRDIGLRKAWGALRDMLGGPVAAPALTA
jgi:hypothetical protein